MFKGFAKTETTMERMLKLSVLVNDLLIPPTAIESILSRYTHPLGVMNDSEDYPCSIIGSSIGIKHKGRYLLLCCRHQLTNALAGRPLEDVGLLDKDGHKFCSAGGIRYFPEINEVDLHDLVVYDFTEPCQERPHMQERFFALDKAPPIIRSDDVVGFVVSGFPTNDQKYDADGKKIDFFKRSIICQLATLKEQSDDPTILRIKPVTALGFNPDGMSGGAAFVILLTQGIAEAFLAGMLVRAGKNDFYLIKIGMIMNVLESF